MISPGIRIGRARTDHDGVAVPERSIAIVNGVVDATALGSSAGK